MNSVKANIEDMFSSGDLVLVTLDCLGSKFSSLLINQQESFLKKGKEVCMIFKETEVALAKGDTKSISLRNQFPSKVISIEKGQVLSEIKLDYKGLNLTSIITTQSCHDLNIQIGDLLTALVKSNEIMLMNND